MSSTSDIVIIGGGIIGLSIAYHLAEKGTKSVTLLEMNQLGSGSSLNVSPWAMKLTDSEENIRLSELGIEEYKKFQAKFDVDIGYATPGVLSIGTQDMIDYFMGEARLLKIHEVDFEILSADDIKRLAPFLNTSDIGIGIFCYEDGPFDGYTVLTTYARQAKRLGVNISEGTHVTNILVEKGKIVAVETTRTKINTPIVINAGGLRAREIGKWVGLDLPIINSIRHELYTEETDIFPRGSPLTEVLAPEEIYVDYALGRNGWQHGRIGIGRDPTSGYEQRANSSRILENYGDALIHRIPGLEAVGFINGTAGIRCLTSDGLPILGPVDGIEGYVNACGWGGFGMTHAPAAGQIISAFILGHPLPCKLEHYMYNRFAKNRENNQGMEFSRLEVEARLARENKY